MVDFREQLSELGLTNVQTYIQSGNILFESDSTVEELNFCIHQLIKSKYGYDVPVLTIEQKKLELVISNNPFIGDEVDIKKLHVTFLENQPINDFPPKGELNGDFYEYLNDVIFVHTPGGYGKTKLHNTYFEKLTGVTCTTRNWNTCNKLNEL